MRASVERRIRVQVVRRRLEEAAAALVERVTGIRPTSHSRVAKRLLLLSAGADDADRRDRHDLARQAGYVYAMSSEVMHSRRAFGDVYAPLVLEWEEVAARVEQVLGRGT